MSTVVTCDRCETPIGEHAPTKVLLQEMHKKKELWSLVEKSASFDLCEPCFQKVIDFLKGETRAVAP